MKIPLYWIDCFKEFDKNMFQKGQNFLKNASTSLIAQYGFDLKFLSLEEIVFGYDDSPWLIYKGENLMGHKACVYIPYSNPHPQSEQLLLALARLVIVSKTWILLNGDQKTLHLDKEKELALALVQKIGANTIPSLFIPERTISRSQIDAIEKRLGPYPYMLKPSSMLAGLGIIKAETREILCSLLDYVAQSPRAYLLQPFLTQASDYRVYLENYEIIACQKRTPLPGNFLANVSQSGKGEAVNPSDKMAEMSIKLAKEISSSYLCIDWLVAKEGLFFSELDFSGMFFGLPEPEQSRVANAFFRSACRKFDQALSTN